MKKIVWLFACFLSFTVFAQEKLVVGGNASDRYVLYNANGQESLLNISNQFGQSVNKLATYNKININPSLPFAKGTMIKVPLNSNNLLQKKSENSEPVYHVIKKGENLSQLSQTYYKVPSSSLKTWNNLKSNIVKTGQTFIVGYMVNAKSVTAQKGETKKDIPAINNTDGVPVPLPERKYADKKEPIIPSAVKKDPVVIIEPKLISKENKVAEVKPKVNSPIKNVELTETYSPKDGDEGFFGTYYHEINKSLSQQFHSGDAATFKSISGWSDRKFYVLVNDIAPKTIVRITGVNKKSICAMVLGPLPETKGSADLLFRISNSCANALGITETKFPLTISYFE